jgi:hypothetical protein
MDCQDLRPALPTLSRGTLLYAARTFLCLAAAAILRRASFAQPDCRYVRRMGAVKLRLFRGRDSNPNLLIQSQLSYH